MSDINGVDMQVFSQSSHNDKPFERNNFKVAGFFQQLKILSWKNLILSKRSKKGLISEIFIPLFLLIILVVIRDLVSIEYVKAKDPPAKNIFNYFDDKNITARNLILYYPNSSLVQDIIKRGVDIIKLNNSKFNATIQAANFTRITTIPATSPLNNLLGFFSFPDSYNETLPDNVEYNLYTQESRGATYKITSSLVDKMSYMFDFSPEHFCADDSNFVLYELFNALKYPIDLSIIETKTNKSMDAPNTVNIRQLPCQGFVEDFLKGIFSFFLTILIQIAFLFTFIVNLNNIIAEKQSKMKEYLKLVGVKWYSIWLTWFLRIFIMYFALSIIFAILSIIPFSSDQLDDNDKPVTKALFNSTNFFLILFTLIVYSIECASFIVVASQFFKKTFLAKVAGVVFWIVTAVNFYGSLSLQSLKYIFCILPNAGLLFAFQTMFQFDRSDKPLDFTSLYRNLFDEPLNLGLILAVMMGYSVFFFIIAWYVEHVMPGEYGVPLPFYFPFMPSYWKKSKPLEASETKEDYPEKENFENEDFITSPTIQIKNISKDFTSGFKTKRVVKNLSLNFYENQVTGLLGHNGAGKTTCTFMLCGIYPPTSGTASILGYDIVRDMDEIRSSLGFCPQHDILYDELNVKEHLEIIAMIKGFPKSKISDEIIRISTYVGLQNDLFTVSKSLSGGMKRRLSVAMALIGDSKIIILDEPTSGLDPFNRRGLWELIRNYKVNRTIILTTHFMEEADALSDRIAIMNHGEVKSCGSPMFLKNTFGSGYNLTVSKTEEFDEKSYLEIIKSNIKDFKIETNVAGEIKVSLPYDAVEKLPHLLSQVEENKNKIGIASYGISSSTIEEVFLKIGGIDKDGNLATGENEDHKNITSNNLETVFSDKTQQKTGLKLWLQQIQALMIKRFLLLKARYALGIVTIFLPILAQAIMCYAIPLEDNVIDAIRQAIRPSGNYTFDLKNYNSYTMPYSIKGNDSKFQELFQKFYSSSNRPNIKLEMLLNDSISLFVLEKRKENVRNIVNNYFTGLAFDVNSTAFTATGYYSTLAYHSSGAILNEISNFILAYYNSNSLKKTISTINSPIPRRDSFYSSATFFQILSCLDILPLSLMNFLTCIIFAIFISFFVAHVGKERINGSKHLQLLSGVHFTVYWIGNFIFDFLICLYTICGIVAVIKLIDAIRNEPLSETYPLANDGNLGYFFFFLFFSSFGWLTYAYVMSHFYKSEIIGFIVLLIILGLSAFIDMVFASLQLFITLNIDSETLKKSLNILMELVRWLFAILFPNVTIKRALFDLKVRRDDVCVAAVNTYFKTNFNINQPQLAFMEPGLGALILVTLFQFIISAALLYLMESKINFGKYFCNNVVHAETETTALEDDVANEFKRIKNTDLQSLSFKEPLIVNDLLMEYKKKKEKFVAVKHLGFGVQRGECFGLLGLNGAGKTTTFKILTGEIHATSGNAFINGFDINKNRFNARRNLGFCPQYDYLPEFLTVEETLMLFARLRGLDLKLISETVKEMINIFKLNEFSNKYVQNLSGGNKRKVNAAIAFLGKPSVVILDEPTTGMDPAARRYLWTLINKARDLGMTIVLTSHSMEECEALCTRLGIMVNGQFKCLGNIQHLKNKYGKGYSLIVKCKISENNLITKTVDDFFKINISLIKLKDQQENTLFYEIGWDNKNSTREKSLSNLFSFIEQNKVPLSIETYSISQTTLEDVFLSFASLQKTEDSDKIVRF